MFVGRESIVHLQMQPSLTILFIMRIDASMNRCKLRLITFFQAFKIKNGTKEPGLKAHCARKMKNPATILRQENVEEVLCDRFT